MDRDQTHDEEGAAPMDPEEQHELAMDRRSVLKRVGLGAAALSVPTAVMASPAMGAVTGRARRPTASSSRTRSGSSPSSTT